MPSGQFAPSAPDVLRRGEQSEDQQPEPNGHGDRNRGREDELQAVRQGQPQDRGPGLVNCASRPSERGDQDDHEGQAEERRATEPAAQPTQVRSAEGPRYRSRPGHQARLCRDEDEQPEAGRFRRRVGPGGHRQQHEARVGHDRVDDDLLEFVVHQRGQTAEADPQRPCAACRGGRSQPNLINHALQLAVEEPAHIACDLDQLILVDFGALAQPVQVMHQVLGADVAGGHLRERASP